MYGYSVYIIFVTTKQIIFIIFGAILISFGGKFSQKQAINASHFSQCCFCATTIGMLQQLCMIIVCYII